MGINAGPFAAHSKQENGEVVERQRKVEGEEKRRERINEVRLNKGFIGVPNAVEEAFPELFEVFIGDFRLGRKPGFEESESFVSGGFVAGGQMLYQYRSFGCLE